MTTTPELRELLNKATPGPWEAFKHDERFFWDIASPEHRVVSDDYEHYGSIFEDSDARLIALAPELAAEVIRLREGIRAQAQIAAERAVMFELANLRTTADEYGAMRDNLRKLITGADQ